MHVMVHTRCSAGEGAAASSRTTLAVTQQHCEPLRCMFWRGFMSCAVSAILQTQTRMQQVSRWYPLTHAGPRVVFEIFTWLCCQAAWTLSCSKQSCSPAIMHAMVRFHVAPTLVLASMLKATGSRRGLSALPPGEGKERHRAVPESRYVQPAHGTLHCETM